jgi:hypothetical protein
MLDIKSNTAFESVVTGASFNTDEGRWHVKTADGRTAKAKYLVVAAGFAAKRYVPDWPGIEKFKGTVHHSSFWPDEEVDVKGKKCAIIGTGGMSPCSSNDRAILDIIIVIAPSSVQANGVPQPLACRSPKLGVRLQASSRSFKGHPT